MVIECVGWSRVEKRGREEGGGTRRSGMKR